MRHVVRVTGLCAALAACRGASEGARSEADSGSGTNETTIVLSIEPEDMTFEADPRFDGSGVLVVEVFDTAHPLDALGSATALYDERFPASAQTGPEVSLEALPEPRITLQNAPSVLYFRVVFFDSAQASAGEELSHGTWMGGVDLSAGVLEDRGLLPVSVTPGTVQTISVDLVALRALSVTVSASAMPVGDGEGPLVVVVTNDPDATHEAPVLGIGGLACASIADMPMTLVIPLVAPGGTYYVTGFLNDLGIDSELAPGELAAMDIDVVAGTGVIPVALELAQRDYTPRTSIDLSFTLPPPSDGVIPPDSCADIAAAAGNAGEP